MLVNDDFHVSAGDFVAPKLANVMASRYRYWCSQNLACCGSSTFFLTPWLRFSFFFSLLLLLLLPSSSSFLLPLPPAGVSQAPKLGDMSLTNCAPARAGRRTRSCSSVREPSRGVAGSPSSASAPCSRRPTAPHCSRSARFANSSACSGRPDVHAP